MNTQPKQSLLYIFLFSFLIFLIQLIQFMMDWDFSVLGIYPRSLFGLVGIIFAPLLHGGFGHLGSNLMVLAVALFILFEFYEKWAWEILLWVWVVGGLMVWAFGRESYHLGSSGILYGINFFILTMGIILRNFRTIALAFVIILMNQGIFWGILPVNAPISWEAHLFSAVVGINLAFLLKNEIKNEIFSISQESLPSELPEEIWNYPKNYHHQNRLEE